MSNPYLEALAETMRGETHHETPVQTIDSWVELDRRITLLEQSVRVMAYQIQQLQERRTRTQHDPK